MSGVKFTVTLSKREAEAVLRSEGFSNGYGVRKSQALQVAEMKIIGAIAAAGLPVGEEAEPK